MSFLALTDADREAMLETIGISSVEDMFADLPRGVRLGRELELLPALEPPLPVAAAPPPA